jgi:hypothetical protein
VIIEIEVRDRSHGNFGAKSKSDLDKRSDICYNRARRDKSTSLFGNSSANAARESRCPCAPNQPRSTASLHPCLIKPCQPTPPDAQKYQEEFCTSELCLKIEVKQHINDR